ncbi:MAG: hypothetical protein ACREA0_25160 [bacterium]
MTVRAEEIGGEIGGEIGEIGEEIGVRVGYLAFEYGSQLLS